MTITLDVTPEMEQELQAEATRRGTSINELAQQSVESMLEELKTRRVPQSLEELKPRVTPPPGKTAMDMVIGQWPGDETEEELLAALKAMD